MYNLIGVYTHVGSTTKYLDEVRCWQAVCEVPLLVGVQNKKMTKEDEAFKI